MSRIRSERAASFRARVTKAIAVLPLVAVLSLACGVSWASSPINTPVHVDIARGTPLSIALVRLAQEITDQTGMHVMVASRSIGHQVSKGLKGTFPVSVALTKLLQGSGLGYSATNYTIAIKPDTAPGTAKPGAFEANPKHGSGNSSGTSDMLQSDDGPPGIADSGTSPQRSSKKHESAALQQVVVTGTHIADVRPVSPVITITSNDIKNSGLPNLASVIRALPQSFSGGLNPTSIVGGGVNGGTSPLNIYTANLRGIGAGANLTLLDGHRLSTNGSSMSVDLSSIPTAAVKRVEIETDGASAIYGADAVSGVVNVILRKKYIGQHTDVYIGGTADGGLTQRYSQLFGRTFWQGTANIMLGYQFQSADEILANQRAIFRAAGANFTLQPQEKSHATFMSFNYHNTPHINSYFQGIYNHRTSLDRFETEEQNTIEDQFAANGGVELHGRNGRTLNVDATFSGDSNSFIEYVTSRNIYDRSAQQNRLFEISLAEQGELLGLPGRRIIRSAFGVGFRKQYFNSKVSSPLTGDRHVTHAYVELNIPVFPASTRRTGIERLLLAAAGRFEHYSDFGSITVPKLGLAWSPLQELTFSATWGKSFQAPSLYALHVGTYLIREPGMFFGLPANREVLFDTGSNAHLRAETARTRTELSSGAQNLNSLVAYVQLSHIMT